LALEQDYPPITCESQNIKIYQLLAHGRGFSPGTPASSTTKTGRHEIAEILLKVALNTKNQIKIILCHAICVASFSGLFILA
jgi:hypothetical protein